MSESKSKATKKPKTARAKYNRPAIPFTGSRKKRSLKKVLEEQAKLDIAGPYVPPRWAYDYIDAYLDPNVPVSTKQRCKAAGISKQTYYTHCKDPEFVSWLNETLGRHVGNQAAQVREAHFKLCLQGNLDAIIAFEDRYIPRDPEVISQMPVRGVMKNVTPARPQIPETASTEPSVGYKNLLGRVIEHHIQKAKAFGISEQIPEEWRKLSEAMEDEKANGVEFH